MLRHVSMVDQLGAVAGRRRPVSLQSNHIDATPAFPDAEQLQDAIHVLPRAQMWRLTRVLTAFSVDRRSWVGHSGSRGPDSAPQRPDRVIRFFGHAARLSNVAAWFRFRGADRRPQAVRCRRRMPGEPGSGGVTAEPAGLETFPRRADHAAPACAPPGDASRVPPQHIHQ